jgi:hypothetical protein
MADPIKGYAVQQPHAFDEKKLKSVTKGRLDLDGDGGAAFVCERRCLLQTQDKRFAGEYIALE